MSEGRCPVCDRGDCLIGKVDRAGRGGLPVIVDLVQLGPAQRECDRHRVDWRARCLAAESALEGMRGERDDERLISQQWEERALTAEQRAAKLHDDLVINREANREWRRAEAALDRAEKAEQEAAALRQERDEARRLLAREAERTEFYCRKMGETHRDLCVEQAEHDKLKAAIADRDQQIAALRELLSESWGAIAGYPFRNDITARIDAALGIDRNATPITHEEIKRALEIGAAERIEAEARVARPGRYASRSIGPNRATIEAEVVEQVRDWVERSTRIAYNPYQQGYAAALLDVASGLRCGAWRSK